MEWSLGRTTSAREREHLRKLQARWRGSDRSLKTIPSGRPGTEEVGGSEEDEETAPHTRHRWRTRTEKTSDVRGRGAREGAGDPGGVHVIEPALGSTVPTGRTKRVLPAGSLRLVHEPGGPTSRSAPL